MMNWQIVDDLTLISFAENLLTDKQFYGKFKGSENGAKTRAIYSRVIMKDWNGNVSCYPGVTSGYLQLRLLRNALMLRRIVRPQ